MRRPPLAPLLAASCRGLRDPQVQVWLMAGLSLLLLLIGHIRAWSPSGEGKNEAAASRLLLAGAQVSWTEAFGPSLRPSRRPLLVLQSHLSPSLAPPRHPAEVPDPRPAMEAASAQPWQFLDRSLRGRIAQAGPAAESLHIRLAYSGDARGHAALVPRRSAAAAFVIGNGSRSGDGRVEFAPGPAHGTAVDVTLIGSGRAPTPRQMAALGELLLHLESRSGHPIQLTDSHIPTPAAF